MGDHFYFKIISANSRRINNMQVSLIAGDEIKTGSTAVDRLDESVKTGGSVISDNE